MYLDQLTMSVFYGTGNQRPEIQKVLEKCPQLRILGQTTDPKAFVSQYQEVSPDVVLVEMNGECQVPEWLEKLPQEMPHTQVLVCSYNREPEFLIRAMQVGIREFLPLPMTKDDLEGALNRVWSAKKRLQPVDSRRGRIIVVTSHKGGAGSTTIAVNLTAALGELTGERLALVDLGRPFPDVGNFLDQESPYSIADLIQNIATLDNSFVLRIMQPYGANLSILHGPSDFKDQESIDLESLERIFSIMRPMYRFIVIDLSHWLDELFLKVMTEADILLMMTGLTIPDLRNLKKLWPFISDWNQEKRKIKIVVNRQDNSSGIQMRDLEHILQLPAYATLPNDNAAVAQCLNQGTPLMNTAPRSKLWRSIKELASQIIKEVDGDEHVGADAATSRKRFWVF